MVALMLFFSGIFPSKTSLIKGFQSKRDSISSFSRSVTKREIRLNELGWIEYSDWIEQIYDYIGIITFRFYWTKVRKMKQNLISSGFRLDSASNWRTCPSRRRWSPPPTFPEVSLQAFPEERRRKEHLLLRWGTSRGTVVLNLKVKKKLLSFAGQIKSFCGPHLARGPYVVLAWSKYWS